MFLIFVIFVFGHASGYLHFHMVQSVCDIVTRHVTPGHTMVVSHSAPAHTPIVPQNKTRHSLVLHPGLNTNQSTRESVFPYQQSSEDLRQMILVEFNKIGRWSLLSFDENADLKQTQPPRSRSEGYLLLTSREDEHYVVQEIKRQLQNLRNNWLWNPRAKFVILLMGTRHTNVIELAGDIFAELWASGVVNSVVLIPALDTQMTADTANVLDAYIWLPYQHVGKCAQVTDALLQNRWILDNTNKGQFLHNVSLFPQKIPRDLHGCPLMLSTFEAPPCIMGRSTTGADPKHVTYNKGLEIQIIWELAKYTNSSLQFRDTPPDGGKWGWDLGNGTWNGVTGEMSRRYSDIGAALLWYRCHLVKEIECTRPHLIDKVKWYVPCARPYPRWTSLSRVFKLSLWLGFITAYVIVSVVMSLVVKTSSNISKEAPQNQAFATLCKCLLNFWAIILEESASNHPPDVAAIRAVFFTWVLYCWAVNNVYQAYFTSFLIDPGLQHQLISEHEIFTSGIEYSTERSLIFLYPELQGHRYRHTVVIQDLAAAEKRVAEGTLALLFSMFLTEYDIAVEYMNADGKPEICFIEDDFAFTLVTTFLPKGSPFKTWYDHVILHLMEGGFMDLWWEKSKYAATLEKAADFNLPPGEYIALTLEHLQSAFYFLFLGYAMSVMSFLLELSIRYRKRREIKGLKDNGK